MGNRKKNNAIRKIARMIAKRRREKNAIKRAAKPLTAGQKLHNLMHGRNA